MTAIYLSHLFKNSTAQVHFLRNEGLGTHYVKWQGHNSAYTAFCSPCAGGQSSGDSEGLSQRENRWKSTGSKISERKVIRKERRENEGVRK